MKVLWIDPVNSDPQFLNSLAMALAQAGHEVIVRSNRRDGYDPPKCISWSSFNFAGTVPRSLQDRAGWRVALASAYPLDWVRAVSFARSSGVKAVLFSTNLALPKLDTWGLASLYEAGILPLVIVHKPYRNFFERPDSSERYRRFYEHATRILVMTSYTQRTLQALYGLPEDRFAVFPLPHVSQLLSGIPVSSSLQDSLTMWAGTHPVISFFSSHSLEHGLGTLLDALPWIRSLVPDIHTLIVSPSPDAPTRRTIELRATEGGFSDKCLFRWTPYCYPELLAYLRVSKLVVIPYNYATQSQVISMAAGFGIPVVATTVGGLSEMVVPGETGELVPPRDPQALAEAIVRVVESGAIPGYRRRAYEFAHTALCPAKAAAIVSECLHEVVSLHQVTQRSRAESVVSKCG